MWREILNAEVFLREYAAPHANLNELGGGFKDFLCSSLKQGEDVPI